MDSIQEKRRKKRELEDQLRRSITETASEQLTRRRSGEHNVTRPGAEEVIVTRPETEEEL